VYLHFARDIAHAQWRFSMCASAWDLGRKSSKTVKR